MTVSIQRCLAYTGCHDELVKIQGEKTRKGAKSGVDLLERMNCGRGIKDREDKSMGMEIHMAESFAKINPTP